MSNIRGALVYLSFDTLDLIVDLDTFISSVMNSLFKGLQVTLKMPNSLALISESIFMVPLALSSFVLKRSDPSLELLHNTLKQLIVPFSCLMVLNLVSV